MNRQDLAMAEEAYYIRKYLPAELVELRIELDCIMPPNPGSVIKMVGRPQAKAPGDPSQTETWGIIRAECTQAGLIYAKQWLHDVLRLVCREVLSLPERQLVRYLYDREQTGRKVRDQLGITHRQFYRLRERVLTKLWPYLMDHESLLYTAIIKVYED